MSAAAEPRLDGRVVMVTGAGQGIGRAYAHAIAAQGGFPIIAEINEENGRHVVDELADDGYSAAFLKLDVSDPASCAAVAATVTDDYGRLDGLVNNAAVFSTISMKPFWEISVAEWDKLMSVNLRGPWLLTTSLLGPLRAAASASIVNIASDAVWLGRSGYLHYVASKGGVAGMTFAMSRELGGFGIRVNAVSPGPTYTEVERETVSPEQKTQMLARQALGREAVADDMVGPVTFLLSSASDFVTGQTLHVNGGLAHF